MILHLDMDAFFAAIEQRDDPSLKGKPVIIGGGDRGVVATASYEARIFGIHSAMPVATAKKLCPQAIFIHGNHHHYSEVSRSIMACLRKISPLVQQASIDEAYIDAFSIRHLYSGPNALAATIKKAIMNVSGGLTCSIGMAPVKFLSKICSDLNKPNGLYILKAAQVENFLNDLKIEKLPGVGKSMAESLHSFGINTVRQLQKLSRDFMYERYGKFGLILYDRARGIDPRQVHENNPAKSESCERTLTTDIRTKEILMQILHEQAEKVSNRLQRNNSAGRTITLKIKFSDFHQITRAHTLEFRTNEIEIIHTVACNLLNGISVIQPVRLIGVAVSGFDLRPEQLLLPGVNPALKKHRIAEQSVIEI